MARKNTTTTTKSEALASRLTTARKALADAEFLFDVMDADFNTTAAGGNAAELASAQAERESARLAVERHAAVIAALESEMPKAQQQDAEALAGATERQLAALAKDAATAADRVREALQAADAAAADLFAANDGMRWARITCASKVGSHGRTPAGGVSVSPELIEQARAIVNRMLGCSEAVRDADARVHMIQQRSHPVEPHPHYAAWARQ